VASEPAILAAGGTIVESTYDFPGGKRFHFRDPEGNVLAVWSQQEGTES
jgi:predicted enzyme related to lactoylglutathione lyase